MKKIVISSVLALVIFWVNGQNSKPTIFKYTGKEFSQKINEYISEKDQFSAYLTNYLSKNYFHLHSNLCNSGIALIRFRVDEPGKITDVAVSKTTPAILAEALKEGLMSSEKYWSLRKRERSKIIIQPILYNYHTKCDEMKFDFYSLRGGIFEFDDTSKVTAFECIILEPLVTSSGVEESDLVDPPKKN